MGQKFAGTCYIKVDGEQLPVEGSVEFPLLDVTRESKIGSTGVVGYAETPIVPFVNVSSYVPPQFPVDALSGDDMTVTVECNNGWVYTLQGAYLVGDANVNPSDGNITLNFNGTKGFLQHS